MLGDFLTLTAGTDFTCTVNGCTSTLFGLDYKILQITINRFASAAGFAPLNIDGIIGDKTVAAAAAAATTAGVSVTNTTPAALAANALTLTAQLAAAAASDLTPSSIATVDLPTLTPPPELFASVQQIVSACNADDGNPICVNAVALCKRVAGTPAGNTAAMQAICSVATNTHQTRNRILIGATVLAALGTGIALVWRRQRGAHSLASRGARNRNRRSHPRSGV